MENLESSETAEKLRTFLQRAQTIRESYTTAPRDHSPHPTGTGEIYTNEIQGLSTRNRGNVQNLTHTHDKLPLLENEGERESLNSPSLESKLPTCVAELGRLPKSVAELGRLPKSVAELGQVSMGMKLNVIAQPEEDPGKSRPGRRSWHLKNSSIEPGTYKNFEIITGGGGFRKLKYDGMLYSVNRITPDQNKVYWRCANRKCNGRVTTQNYEIVGATDHSLEAHSGGGGGYSAKTMKHLQTNVPARVSGKLTPPQSNLVSNNSGTKAPSPAPSSGDVTHLREHAPNPYAPAMYFGHSNKKTPTPPQDILRDFQGQGQTQGQSQGHIDELSRRFKFGANRKKTPTPPCSPYKCASRHVTYEINDIAAKLSGVHARRSGTPVLPPRKRPLHPPRPPFHQAFPPPRMRPPVGGLVSREGLPHPREQNQDSSRGLDYYTGLPNNAIKRPADAEQEDLTCTKATGSYNMDECKYNNFYFVNI